MPEPGISRARYPCVCVLRRRPDAPSDKAKKRPFLGRFDAERPETRGNVFPPRKREKTDIPTAGDDLSPAGALWLAPLRARKRTHETRIHGIQWISWISWIFSGKRAFARICEVRGAWIFCGFRGFLAALSAGASIRPKNGPFWGVSMRAERKPVEASFPLENAKKRTFQRSVTKCHQIRLMARTFARMETHASPTSWGYWGYWGYSSQSRENTGLFARPRRGYFGGYFRGRGFLVALSAGASMRRPQIATLRRIRWDERPETRGNVRLAHLRARYPCVCAGICVRTRHPHTVKSAQA